MDALPTVDLALPLAAAAEQLHEACTTVGFFQCTWLFLLSLLSLLRARCCLSISRSVLLPPLRTAHPLISFVSTLPTFGRFHVGQGRAILC